MVVDIDRMAAQSNTSATTSSQQANNTISNTENAQKGNKLRENWGLDGYPTNPEDARELRQMGLPDPDIVMLLTPHGGMGSSPVKGGESECDGDYLDASRSLKQVIIDNNNQQHTLYTYVCLPHILIYCMISLSLGLIRPSPPPLCSLSPAAPLLHTTSNPHHGGSSVLSEEYSELSIHR